MSPISLFSPWSILGIAVVTVGAYASGRIDGSRLAEATQAREERIAQVVTEKANDAAAKAIAAIGVRNVTLRQTLQKEVIREPVYVDCQHSPIGLQSVNDALANKAVAPGNGELSRANTAQR